ncbi:MAG: efflux RND transporter periplasmic adaptor subunit [Acidobacteriota bacterium]|nr:efflux RND transporter periplasmic adaptor subunit [Acidobacteriota bacterium]
MTFFKTERKTIVRLAILMIFSIIFAAGCGRSKSAEPSNDNQAAQNEEVFPITQAKAVARNVPAFITATGSLAAIETSDIAPKTAGKVINVGVNAGDFVTQGTIIAKTDERDAQLQLAQAQASAAQTVSGVRQAEARLGLTQNGTFSAAAIPEVRAADANYEQAVALLKQAEANEQRYRELVETGDVSSQNYENYRTIRDTARAQLNSARQQVESARNTARQSNEAVKSAQAAVKAAQTQIELAKQAIADTVIRAPFAGFISSRPVAVGEFVSTATIVATVLRTNPIKAELQVNADNVPLISVGQGVSITIDAYQDRKFGGTVSAVNPSIDAATRTAIVEATFENNNNALRQGMFATANITKQGGGQGVFVPRPAVYNDQSTQSYRVFVIQDNIAKLRVVQIGAEEGDFIQILSGVSADETVATSNLDKLYEGARVSF